jgi:hypothetical protein
LLKSPSSLVPFHSLFNAQVLGKGAEQKQNLFHFSSAGLRIWKNKTFPFLFCGLENLEKTKSFSFSLQRARELGRSEKLSSAQVPSTGAQNLSFFLFFSLLLVYIKQREFRRKGGVVVWRLLFSFPFLCHGVSEVNIRHVDQAITQTSQEGGDRFQQHRRAARDQGS